MASKTPSPAGLSPPQRFPLHVYGRFVPGAKEDVSGWRLIREVEIPAQDGKLPHFGEAVAFARDISTAHQMAAAPDLLLAVKELLVYLADIGTAVGHPLHNGKPTKRAWAAIAKAEGRS